MTVFRRDRLLRSTKDISFISMLVAAALATGLPGCFMSDEPAGDPEDAVGMRKSDGPDIGTDVTTAAGAEQAAFESGEPDGTEPGSDSTGASPEPGALTPAGCLAGDDAIVEGDFFIDGEDTEGDIAALSGVSTIKGSLYILDTGLESLKGLECLRQVSGNLSIGYWWTILYRAGDPFYGPDEYGNPGLASLDGLQGLELVGGNLVIKYNDSLTDLRGLDHLRIAVWGLLIEDNRRLASLTGLESLRYTPALTVSRNDALTSLAVLGRLSVTEMVQIYENALLTDLRGLERVVALGSLLGIVRNDSLTSLTGLENLRQTGAGLTISGNDSLVDITALDSVTSLCSERSLLPCHVHLCLNPQLRECDVDELLSRVHAACDPESCQGNLETPACP